MGARPASVDPGGAERPARDSGDAAATPGKAGRSAWVVGLPMLIATFGAVAGPLMAAPALSPEVAETLEGRVVAAGTFEGQDVEIVEAPARAEVTATPPFAALDGPAVVSAIRPGSGQPRAASVGLDTDGQPVHTDSSAGFAALALTGALMVGVVTGIAGLSANLRERRASAARSVAPGTRLRGPSGGVLVLSVIVAGGLIALGQGFAAGADADNLARTPDPTLDPVGDLDPCAVVDPASVEAAGLAPVVEITSRWDNGLRMCIWTLDAPEPPDAADLSRASPGSISLWLTRRDGFASPEGWRRDYASAALTDGEANPVPVEVGIEGWPGADRLSDCGPGTPEISTTRFALLLDDGTPRNDGPSFRMLRLGGETELAGWGMQVHAGMIPFTGDPELHFLVQSDEIDARLQEILVELAAHACEAIGG